MDGDLPYVLIIEDSPDTADSFGELLTLWGYDAGICYDGTSALRNATRRQPSVVLLDIAMPKMNGFDFLDQFRKLPGCVSVPVVVVTGMTAESHRCRARGCGVSEYLVKPVDLGGLQTLLVGLLTKSEPKPVVRNAEKTIPSLIPVSENAVLVWTETPIEKVARPVVVLVASVAPSCPSTSPSTADQYEAQVTFPLNSPVRKSVFPSVSTATCNGPLIADPYMTFPTDTRWAGSFATEKPPPRSA